MPLPVLALTAVAAFEAVTALPVAAAKLGQTMQAGSSVQPTDRTSRVASPVDGSSPAW
ncbi:MAG TPA: hypothetical protein VE198_15290 [Actinoallomurus sp.]|nr:hypothetical protein [Actinoallomurus sp.]